MENPFNEISERLERIENLLTDHHQMKVEPIIQQVRYFFKYIFFKLFKVFFCNEFYLH